MNVVPLQEENKDRYDDILEEAKGRFKDCLIVVGWDFENDMSYITSGGHKHEMVYLLERMKFLIMKGELDA